MIYSKNKFPIPLIVKRRIVKHAVSYAEALIYVSREWLTRVHSRLRTVYAVLRRGIRNTRAFLEYMPVYYAHSWTMTPFSFPFLCPLVSRSSLPALSLRKPISRSLRGVQITIVAYIRKSVRGTKVRHDLHVGSGISRHLHRLFASSPVINSPALPITFSPLYIHTCAASFQFTQLWSRFTYSDLSSRRYSHWRTPVDLLLLLQTDSSDDIASIEHPPLPLPWGYSTVCFSSIKIFITLRAYIYDPRHIIWLNQLGSDIIQVPC